MADLILLAAAGYATVGIWAQQHRLGCCDWLGCGVGSRDDRLCSHIGCGHGVGNFFDGPMAKPARMWVLVVAGLARRTALDARGVFLATGFGHHSYGFDSHCDYAAQTNRRGPA